MVSVLIIHQYPLAPLLTKPLLAPQSSPLLLDDNQLVQHIVLLAECCQPARWFCQAAVAGWKDWGCWQNGAAPPLVPSSAGCELSVVLAEGPPLKSNLSLPRYKFQGWGVKFGKKCKFQLSPPMSRNRGGPPQPLLITDGFIRCSRVGNKSNRY